MTVYEPPELDVDRGQIQQDMIDDLEASIPGLDVAPGTLLWFLTLTWADRHAEQLELLSERAQGEYQAFGEKILGLPMVTATQASTTATVTAIDNAGYTLTAGTQVSIDGPDGRIAFYVADDVIIPPGSTTTATGEVTLIAVDGGSQATGLSASPQLEQTLSWVSTITLTGATTGGADAEADDDYVARLSARLGLLSDTLVTPDDFQTYAQAQTGVGRALAIDLYDAGTSTANVGGHVTVAITQADGTAASGGVKTAVAAALTGNAETNMAVHVVDANYQVLAIVFVGLAATGYLASDVQARSIQAVQDFLAPANWGLPTTEAGLTASWTNTPVVRFQDISAVLNGVEGFDHWTTLTINGGTADVTMTGIAPLPSPSSTVGGTVT